MLPVDLCAKVQQQAVAPTSKSLPTPRPHDVWRADVRMEHLRRSPRSSFCEWKGQATYYDVVVGDKVAPAAAWSYPQPSPSFSSIKDHIAFYPQYMDVAYVDGERVTPQPGEDLDTCSGFATHAMAYQETLVISTMPSELT